MHAFDSCSLCLVSVGSTWIGDISTSTKTPDKAGRAEGQVEVDTHGLAAENPGDYSTVWSVLVRKDKVLPCSRKNNEQHFQPSYDITV